MPQGTHPTRRKVNLMHLHAAKATVVVLTLAVSYNHKSFKIYIPTSFFETLSYFIYALHLLTMSFASASSWVYLGHATDRTSCSLLYCVRVLLQKKGEYFGRPFLLRFPDHIERSGRPIQVGLVCLSSQSQVAGP